MNTWGMINSFGVFQTYYAGILPGRPPSDISWIGSITVFLLFFLGSFTGRLTDAGLFRPIFLLGSALQMAGLVATSFCTRYYQLLLAQGICLGLGCGCLFCPCLAHRFEAVCSFAACWLARSGRAVAPADRAVAAAPSLSGPLQPSTWGRWVAKSLTGRNSSNPSSR